ncbi:nitroreductase family protein [Bacillus sp. Marseille-P3800]|uniref:nitroreductase family protein n=1 Tax=Bacillus sp. Marseille-P3800 TaxID=2014782 RepID=UPI0021002B1E|nr:nitroreductase family protein [Bacillus sp. Marseille-P3800]
MSKWSRLFKKDIQTDNSTWENPVPPGMQKEGTEKADDDFYQAIENRRSIYVLSKDTVQSDKEIKALIEQNLQSVPFYRDTPSSRIVLLLHDEHDRFWQQTRQTLRSIMDYSDFVDTQAKLEMFEHAYGTILFFEDEETFSSSYTESIAQQYAGMLQFSIWVSLEANGFGASLQHYNPMIDDEVKRTWNLPSSWKLGAQMPFGRPHEYPNAKEFRPMNTRFKIEDS